MINFKCLSTGSIGNCYLLETENETLVIDCGIPFKEIKVGLDFDLSRVVGVIVSHTHQDHCKSVSDFKKYGVDVWQPYLDEKKIQKKQFGGFKVQCFGLPHNGTENRGFLIEAEGQKVLYMTDFEYCPYRFTGQKVNHILIECNYQSEYVEKNLPQYEHKIRGHCSLKTCKEFIEVNATDSLETVILLHMGEQTCNPMECALEVQKVANKAYVDYATKGFEVELNKKGEYPSEDI